MTVDAIPCCRPSFPSNLRNDVNNILKDSFHSSLLMSLLNIDVSQDIIQLMQSNTMHGLVGLSCHMHLLKEAVCVESTGI